MAGENLMVSYCGTPPLPGDLLLRWNLDPVLLLGLAVCAIVALRSLHPRLALSGVAVLALVFVSPLCALSVALFSARAMHHILLVTCAAPLIAAAFPARCGGHLAIALLASTTSFWVWHLPTPYDQALANSAIYWLMQVSLLGTAIWFWRNLFAAEPLPATLAATFAMTQMGLLGALLTFAPDALYTAHAGTTQAWGMGQIADQQLAGLMMWVPGIIPYGVAAALVARRIWTRAVARA